MDATQAKDKVLAVLKSAGEPMRPGDIAEKAGLDKKDVEKAIKALKTDGLIESPKRCFWAAV